MNKTDTLVAQKLRAEGLLDQFQHKSVLDYLAENGGRLHMAVLALGFVPEEKLVQVVSQACGFPVASLSKMRIDVEARPRLSASFCEKHCVFPCSIRDQGSTLWLAMADPTDIGVINSARKQSRLKIRPLLARPSEIRDHIRTAYRNEVEPESPYVAGAIDLSLEPGEDEGEFKITDLAGKTMVRHTGEVTSGAPPARQTAGDPPGGEQALRARLHKLLVNQRKTDRLIAGLARLLADKGMINLEALPPGPPEKR